MSESQSRRPRVLSPETKWGIFLQVTAGEIAQADAARKWQVDVLTIIGIRRTAKDAAMAAFARKPGRPGKEGDWQLEAARSEIGQLTEVVKAQAIELAVIRGDLRSVLLDPDPQGSPARARRVRLTRPRRQDARLHRAPLTT